MGYRKKLVVDVFALVAYIAASMPFVTGIGLHEWLGLGLIVVLLAHCTSGVGWMLSAVRNPAGDKMLHFALAMLLLLALAATAVSGLMISGAVLPVFGYVAPGFYFWNPLHALAAKVLMALLIVHLVLHARLVHGVVAKWKGSRHGKRSRER